VIAAFNPTSITSWSWSAITGMPVIANLIAGKIAFLRQMSFIEAAHALGLPAHTVVLKAYPWLNCPRAGDARHPRMAEAYPGRDQPVLPRVFGVQEPRLLGKQVQAAANYFLQGNFWPSTAPAPRDPRDHSRLQLLATGSTTCSRQAQEVIAMDAGTLLAIENLRTYFYSRPSEPSSAR